MFIVPRPRELCSEEEQRVEVIVNAASDGYNDTHGKFNDDSSCERQEPYEETPMLTRP